MDSRTGVVLAGGRSTRFDDGDKAVADLAGTPMIRHVVDRIAPVVDDVVINCRAEQVPAIEHALEGWPRSGRGPTDDDTVGNATAGDPTPYAFATDSEPDRGPMAGITTGLREATGEYAFVVACDMPFVDPALASYLFERVAGHDAAVPRLDDRWFQTTQAVYRTDPMADAGEAALAHGERKIIEALFDLDYVVVAEAEVRERASLETFENVNTREELAEAAARIDPR